MFCNVFKIFSLLPNECFIFFLLIIDLYYLDNCSLNSWVNEINHDSDDHNSDSEFNASEHSEDDISMSDDSDDNILVDQENSLDHDVPNFNLQDGGEIDDDDNIEDEEEEEEDDVVAAFISASSDRNRNHPPNLLVHGGSLIGGFSFHPNTNVIAIGLSTGDILMYDLSTYFQVVNLILKF